jgi:hypothetical protein
MNKIKILSIVIIAFGILLIGVAWYSSTEIEKEGLTIYQAINTNIIITNYYLREIFGLGLIFLGLWLNKTYRRVIK